MHRHSLSDNPTAVNKESRGHPRVGGQVVRRPLGELDTPRGPDFLQCPQVSGQSSSARLAGHPASPWGPTVFGCRHLLPGRLSVSIGSSRSCRADGESTLSRVGRS